MTYIRKANLSFPILTDRIKELAKNGKKFRAGQSSTIPNTTRRVHTGAPTANSSKPGQAEIDYAERYKEFYENYKD